MAGGTDGRKEAEIQSDAGRQGGEFGGVAQRSIRCAGDVWHSGAYRGPRDDQRISLSVVADADGRLSRHGGEQDDAQGAKAKAGDVVDVVMERDEEARTVEAPPELKKELAKSKKAQQRWDDLAFTHKKELAISIREAKQEETRKRRLAKVMQVLKTGENWTG